MGNKVHELGLLLDEEVEMLMQEADCKSVSGESKSAAAGGAGGMHMENRNELDLGLMTTEDMKSVEKVFEEQNDTEMRSASAVAAGAGGAAGGAGGASGATAAKA